MERLVAVTKVKEREAGTESPHQDSRAVRHHYIDCSPSADSSTCTFPLSMEVLSKGMVADELCSTERTYAPLPISRLQQFIAQARIPTTEPITLNTLISSNIVHGLSNKFSGIKLLGDIDPSLPLPPLKLYLSRYSKSAAKAVMDAGGEVTAVYRNKLGLRAEKLGAVDQIKMADPTRKNDIGKSTAMPW